MAPPNLPAKWALRHSRRAEEKGPAEKQLEARLGLIFTHGLVATGSPAFGVLAAVHVCQTRARRLMENQSVSRLRFPVAYLRMPSST